MLQTRRPATLSVVTRRFHKFAPSVRPQSAVVQCGEGVLIFRQLTKDPGVTIDDDDEIR